MVSVSQVSNHLLSSQYESYLEYVWRQESRFFHNLWESVLNRQDVFWSIFENNYNYFNTWFCIDFKLSEWVNVKSSNGEYGTEPSVMDLLLQGVAFVNWWPTSISAHPTCSHPHAKSSPQKTFTSALTSTHLELWVSCDQPLSGAGLVWTLAEPTPAGYSCS